MCSEASLLTTTYYIIELLLRTISTVFQVKNKEKSISKHHYSYQNP